MEDISFFSEKFKDGDHIKEFIENICKDFKKELIQNYEDLAENPLLRNPLYMREDTLRSYLFPSLMRHSKRTIMEVYFHNGGNNYPDFYSLSKDGKSSYIIEFKHFGGGFSNGLTVKWDKVNSQIKRLEPLSVNKYIDKDKTIYGMSFLIMVYVVSNKNKIKITEEYLQQELKSCCPENDWFYIWKVPEDMNGSQGASDYFSHVFFVGKTKKIDESEC